MSKRGFTILIIILIIILSVILGFLYFRKKTIPGAEKRDTFFQFRPFRGDREKKPPEEPIIPIEPVEPVPPIIISEEKLKKVSSMSIAGFTLFQKERLKEVDQQLSIENQEQAKEEIREEIKEEAKVEVEKENKKEETSIKKAEKKPLTEFMTTARYIARSNGDVYQTFADKINEKKFFNISIPRVYEAYFTNNGKSVFIRYLKNDDKTIETFHADLPEEKPEEKVENQIISENLVENNNNKKGEDKKDQDKKDKDNKSDFLPENVLDMSVLSNSSKVFYLFRDGKNVIGVIFDTKKNKRTQIFDSQFTEWLSQWPTDDNKKIITLTTKPSFEVPGYIYALNPETTSFNKIFGGINGLTTLTSPDGNLILYADSSLKLKVYNIKENTTNDLGIKTMPEKCLWSKNSLNIYCGAPKSLTFSGYPDAWYKGEESFSDRIIKVNLEDNNVINLVDPVEIKDGEEIDAIKLAISEDEKFLFFVNKKDSYLWMLNLE